MKIDYQNLEKKIKINFKEKKILSLAFIHKSYDSKINNEKLEFLGDRILGFIIAKKLLELFPSDKEGLLDKKLSSLVNKDMCLKVAKQLNLDKYIKTGTTPSKNYKIEDKISSDSCEALIGAIFLDQGLKSAETFILNFWKSNLSESLITKIDAKTKLQEYSLKKFKKLPIYKIISNTGPRHKPIFKVSVKLPDSKLYVGHGASKKDAEQNAAILCIDNIL